MADITIPIVVKDADTAELVSAAKKFYGQIQDGDTMRDRTPAECVDAYKLDCLKKMRWIVYEYRQAQAPAIEEPTLGE